MVHPSPMSAPSHDSHGESAEHDHDVFDPEPIKTLPAGEPPTPLALSAFGLGVLLLAALFLLLGGGSDDTDKASPKTAAPKAVVKPQPAAKLPQPIDAAQRANLRKRLEQIRKNAAGKRPGGKRLQGGR